MKLSTITNWAYGATLALTALSGSAMLMASNALDEERRAVAQRYVFDQATSRLALEVFAAAELAREYVLNGDAAHLAAYEREARRQKAIEHRVQTLRDVGASVDELASLHEAIRLSHGLRNEERAAIDAYRSGNADLAREILFSAEFEREIERAEMMIERFQYRLDQRIANKVAASTMVAKAWKSVSEIVLALTGLLFLCVLYFVFKRRVLRPVVRLSDVVGRLAAQDYGAEPPEFGQIDEIGDMAQAIKIFRENGLARQRLEQEREADLALRDLLARMTQRMQGCDDLDDLKEVIERFIPMIAPELAGGLYVIDETRRTLVEICRWQDPSQSRTEFGSLSCWALRRALPHRPRGERIDVPCDHLVQEGAEPADTLCLPLIAHHETLGLLYFELIADKSVEHRTPQTYLEVLTETVSLALGNLRLRERLRKLALADSLTGLSNRHQLDAVLMRKLTDAENSGNPVSCLMLDVDHFKQFNDRFGHAAGDAVLREVGQVLASAARERDTAFRYGGEEFLLLLEGVGPEQARERAEEIRVRIECLELDNGEQALGPVTASIGMASWPAHGPANRLVALADAALLRAKAQGRNRVEVADNERRADGPRRLRSRPAHL